MINILVVLGLYLFMVAYMYMKQRAYIYFPNNPPTAITSPTLQKAQNITVKTDDGLSLSALYIPPKDQNQPVIVFFHGNGGDIGDRGYRPEPYIPMGYGFLLAEYRGYWGNDGKPSEQGFYADARAYIEWLINDQGIQQDKIVLFGESLGTGVAVEMALRYPRTKALVLMAPYTTLPDVGQRHMFYLPVKLLAKDRFDSLSKIGNIKVPLLILHGRKDTIVPFDMGENLFAAAPEPKKMEVFDEGGHIDLLDYGEAQRVIHFLTATQ